MSYSPATATDILQLGIATLEQRGRDRDRPSGERSMLPVVSAFEALTGHRMTEQQGWLFMALVKFKRSQSGKPDLDHYVDGANYFALAGESALAASRFIDCPDCERTGLLPGSGGSSAVTCPTCKGAGDLPR